VNITVCNRDPVGLLQFTYKILEPVQSLLVSQSPLYTNSEVTICNFGTCNISHWVFVCSVGWEKPTAAHCILLEMCEKFFFQITVVQVHICVGISSYREEHKSLLVALSSLIQLVHATLLFCHYQYHTCNALCYHQNGYIS